MSFQFISEQSFFKSRLKFLAASPDYFHSAQNRVLFFSIFRKSPFDNPCINSISRIASKIFLLEMCVERQRLKGENAFRELTCLLSKEDLKSIRESSEEFREKFAPR